MSNKEKKNIKIIRKTLETLIGHPKAFYEAAKDYFNAGPQIPEGTAANVKKTRARAVVEEKEILSFFSLCINNCLHNGKYDTAYNIAMLKLNKSVHYPEIAAEAVLTDLAGVRDAYISEEKNYTKAFDIIKTQHEFITAHPTHFIKTDDWFSHLAASKEISNKLLKKHKNIELADAVTRFTVTGAIHIQDGLTGSKILDAIASNGLFQCLTIGEIYIEKKWPKAATGIYEFAAREAAASGTETTEIIRENAFNKINDISHSIHLSRDSIIKSWKNNMLEISSKKGKKKADNKNGYTPK